MPIWSKKFLSALKVQKTALFETDYITYLLLSKKPAITHLPSELNSDPYTTFIREFLGCTYGLVIFPYTLPSKQRMKGTARQGLP
jgi:hypothetical protein